MIDGKDQNCRTDLGRQPTRCAPYSARVNGPIPLADIIRQLIRRVTTMNRRKKINQLLKANAKKASAKLAPKKKSTYISKADRLKLAAEATQDPAIASDS
ncbi:hypothetical protein POS17_3521 [Pseudomonas sp. Os17]|nr:hypothetical protein POS17_3521 [Pseudomonas sp. Os17]